MIAALPLILLLQTPASPRQAPAAGCVPTGDAVVMSMCMAEELTRRGDGSPRGSAAQTKAWRGAADEFRRAAMLARDPATKKGALEQLAQLLDEHPLAVPGAADPVLRELIAANPSSLDPIFRLAKVQEGQNMLDAAESTLLGARQQHPDAPEPYHELAEFFARRALAIETATAAEKQGLRQEPGAAAAAPQPEPGTPDENGVYSVGGSIAPPALVSTVPADAPEAIRAAAGVDALVCEIVVDETGRVRDAKVMKSVAMLDDVALTAVRQWRYAPTLVDGRAVPVRMVVTVPFAR